MFEKILGRFGKEKKEEHPLASDAAIDRLITDFPAGDPARLLFEVAQWLDDVGRFATELPAQALRHAVMRLDDFAHPAYSTLYARFLTPGAREHLSERIWATLESHCRHVHGAHHYLLGAALTNPELAQDSEQLTHSATRGMLALINCKKLLRYRYRVADDEWWRQAGDLLALARKLKVHKTPQRVYLREDLRLGTRDLYMVGVYLEMAPLGSLAHPQIEAFERFLIQNATLLEMLHAPGPASTHRIDLKAGNGPVPIGDGDADGEGSLRFCSGRPLRARLIALSTELRGTAPLPAWVTNIPCTREQMQGLIKALLLFWSDAPPRREATRRSQTARLLVLHGFVFAHGMLDGSREVRNGTYGAKPKVVADNLVSQDLRFGQTNTFTLIGGDLKAKRESEPSTPPATALEALQRLETTLGAKPERWLQTDASDTGLGATVPGLNSIYSAGGLICYRQEQDIEWQLGIIRRIARNEDGNTSIGIEKLAGPSRCATIAPMAENSAALGTIPEIDESGSSDAILVADRGDELLLTAGKFVSGQTLLLKVEGDPRGVRLIALLDEDDNYQRVRFAPMKPPAH